MKKKLIIILIIVFLCIGGVFVYYKFDTANRIKDSMLENSQYLMKNICNSNYKNIGIYLRDEQGKKLSDEQIENFLFNTQFYRSMLIKDKEKQNYVYSTDVNYFNPGESSITLSFKALDGDLIKHKFKYINKGAEEYFVADNTEKCDVEKEKLPMALDLANGTVLEHDENPDEDKEIANNTPYTFVEDEDKNTYILVNKEIKDDLVIYFSDMIYEELNCLKYINKDYDIKWDKEYKEFSVYYDESVESKIIAKSMRVKMLASSSFIQTLNGNGDWHLTINFYDFQTKELLHKEIFR